MFLTGLVIVGTFVSYPNRHRYILCVLGVSLSMFCDRLAVTTTNSQQTTMHGKLSGTSLVECLPVEVSESLVCSSLLLMIARFCTIFSFVLYHLPFRYAQEGYTLFTVKRLIPITQIISYYWQASHLNKYRHRKPILSSWT